MVALETVSIADGDIAVTYLQQVGPDPHLTTPDRAAQIDAVASQIADFIGEARSTIDVAIYDFRLRDEAARIVSGALRAAVKRGVAIRIAYDAVTNAGNEQARPTVPVNIEADKKSPGTETFVSSFTDIAEIRPITGYRVLMHNKYIIRDGLSADAAVFTGSANFTNDSWGLQENNLLFINSQELSSYYATDFAELWSRHKVIESTGYNDTGTIHIRGLPITVIFTPGESSRAVMEIVGAIGVAQRRLYVASVVISSGPILAALSEAIDRGIPLAGLYDGPQMDQVVRQWNSTSVGADRLRRAPSGQPVQMYRCWDMG